MTPKEFETMARLIEAAVKKGYERGYIDGKKGVAPNVPVMAAGDRMRLDTEFKRATTR